MTTSPRTAQRVLLALSGWAALLTTLLAPGDPVRAVVTTAFLLSCPGTAALRFARPTPTRPVGAADRLAAAVLALALSTAMSALVAEAFFLSHTFTVERVLLTLATLTTVLALVPRRIRRGTVDGARYPSRTRRTARRPGGRRLARRTGPLAAAGLLALATACQAAGGDRPAGEQPTDRVVSEQGADGSAGGHQPVAPGSWHPVLQEEFSGTTLDRAVWTTCYDWNDDGCTNPGNPEKEWYLPGQVSVADGVLTLTAEHRSVHGSDGKTYPWISGMVSTGKDSLGEKPHRTFTYGYFAAAVLVPERPAGLFPAFWLAPLDARSNPDELDVAEFINSNQYVDLNLHFGPHYDGERRINHQAGPVDFAAGWHVFAMDWGPDSVTWYVDGTPVFQVTESAAIPHEPMEVLIDLAVGFEQSPPDDVDSARLKVDWVEVWQH